MSVALLRSNRCSRLSYERRPRRADFAPRSRDPAFAGELALLRSVSVNLAELRRAGALVRSEPCFARAELPPSPRLRRTCRRVAP